MVGAGVPKVNMLFAGPPVQNDEEDTPTLSVALGERDQGNRTLRLAALAEMEKLLQ